MALRDRGGDPCSIGAPRDVPNRGADRPRRVIPGSLIPGSPFPLRLRQGKRLAVTDGRTPWRQYRRPTRAVHGSPSPGTSRSWPHLVGVRLRSEGGRPLHPCSASLRNDAGLPWLAEAGGFIRGGDGDPPGDRRLGHGLPLALSALGASTDGGRFEKRSRDRETGSGRRPLRRRPRASASRSGPDRRASG
jgi:hypothetical protein